MNTDKRERLTKWKPKLQNPYTNKSKNGSEFTKFKNSPNKEILFIPAGIFFKTFFLFPPERPFSRAGSNSENSDSKFHTSLHVSGANLQTNFAQIMAVRSVLLKYSLH
jgi:hypothetical protein